VKTFGRFAILVLIGGLLPALASCEKEYSFTDTASPSEPSNLATYEIELTRKDGYVADGWSFSLNKKVQADKADICFDGTYIRGSDHCKLRHLGLYTDADFDLLEEAPAEGYTVSPSFGTGHGFIGHTGDVFCAAFSSNDKWLFGKIHVLHAATAYESESSLGSVRLRCVIQENGTRSFPIGPSLVKERLLTRSATLKQKREELERIVNDSLPAFRRRLVDDVNEVTHDMLARKTPVVEEKLNRELREIARSLLASEKHQSFCLDTILLAKSSERHLRRLIEAQATLGDDAQTLLDEAEAIERNAASLLEVPLTRTGMPAGSIEDIEIDKKIEQLMRPDPKA